MPDRVDVDSSDPDRAPTLPLSKRKIRQLVLRGADVVPESYTVTRYLASGSARHDPIDPIVLIDSAGRVTGVTSLTQIGHVPAHQCFTTRLRDVPGLTSPGTRPVRDSRQQGASGLIRTGA